MDNQIRVDADTLRSVVADAVSDAFLKVGLDVHDAKETQADLLYLREWRKTMQMARNQSVITTIKWFILGIFGLIVTGLFVKVGG